MAAGSHLGPRPCTQERSELRPQPRLRPRGRGAAPPGCPFLILMISRGRPRPPGRETGVARGLATWKEVEAGVGWGVCGGQGHWGRTQVVDEGTVLSPGARGPLLLVPQTGAVSAGNQAMMHYFLAASLRGTHRAPPPGGFSGSLGEPAEGRLLPFSFFLDLSRVRLSREGRQESPSREQDHGTQDKSFGLRGAQCVCCGPAGSAERLGLFLDLRWRYASVSLNRK